MNISIRLFSFIITSLLFSSCFFSNIKPSDRKSSGRVRREIVRTISDYTTPDLPGLSVLVVKDGRTIINEGFGLASMENEIPADAGTLYKIGSITKQFTAVGIMILRERNLLSLEDSLGMFYEENPDKLKSITIRQLLNHTSGIRNHNEIESWQSRISIPITKEELINTFINEPAYFEPGAGSHYSNSGYVLLGDIIEKISGKKYEDFMIDEIFTALGLKNTCIGNDSSIIPGMADGYRQEDIELLRAEYMSMTHTFASGSIITTTGDLAKWLAGLENNKLISNESLLDCFENGFGWFEGELEELEMFYMGGGVYGFVSYSAYIPSEKLYIAILANCVNPHPAVSKEILGELILKTVLENQIINDGIEFKSANLSEDQLEIYTGKYRFKTGGIRKITIENGKVYYEVPPFREERPWHKNEIIPANDSVFFSQGKRTYISFQFDEDKVISLTVNQPHGKKITIEKIAE
jgi:CubicO group peptidase (beta-lactamase class C family)